MKDTLLEGSDALESQGIHMLGQMRHGSCHPRAILFKVLADAAGIDSTLVAVSPLSAEFSWHVFHIGRSLTYVEANF